MTMKNFMYLNMDFLESFMVQNMMDFQNKKNLKKITLIQKQRKMKLLKKLQN